VLLVLLLLLLLLLVEFVAHFDRQRMARHAQSKIVLHLGLAGITLLFTVVAATHRYCHARDGLRHLHIEQYWTGPDFGRNPTNHLDRFVEGGNGGGLLLR